MNRAEYAVDCFARGFNCAQSVFSAYCEEFGLSSEKALKISTAFGGGMGHIGETCGVVTGVFMAIGLKYGRTRTEDLEAKEKTYALVQEFTHKFKSIYGSVRCKDLIGCDLSTDKGMETAIEKDLFNILCVNFVSDAVKILEQLLY